MNGWKDICRYGLVFYAGRFKNGFCGKASDEGLRADRRYMMDFIKKKKERFLYSAAVGMLACLLAAGEGKPSMPLAWWGFLYPKFCIVKETEDYVEETKDLEREGKKEVQFSLWLAIAFEW